MKPHVPAPSKSISIINGIDATTIEYQTIAWEQRTKTKPLLVFLHEGLGSVSLWRDFPQRVCMALSLPGLVYSRGGYGRSSARPLNERWTNTHLLEEGVHALPALLNTLQLEDDIVLIGHSDGASIALAYAAMAPKKLRAIILMAPHVFVEPICLSSVQTTCHTYLTQLKPRLARHHDCADSAFYGWSQMWLDPSFTLQEIYSQLPQIVCPVLAMQGVQDEYGTMAQLDQIKQQVPQTQLLAIDQCGHSPQNDQPQIVIEAIGNALIAWNLV
jgi:pimeloyl-ACP methyl ester carboxylesterase